MIIIVLSEGLAARSSCDDQAYKLRANTEAMARVPPRHAWYRGCFLPLGYFGASKSGLHEWRNVILIEKAQKYVPARVKRRATFSRCAMLNGAVRRASSLWLGAYSIYVRTAMHRGMYSRYRRRTELCYTAIQPCSAALHNTSTGTGTMQVT